MSQDKDYGIINVGAAAAVNLYKQGLLYPLNESSVDRPANRFNKMIENLFTFNGKTYATSIGTTADYWQGGFLFWNKRLFQDAGLDPDLLYDLQKAGTWNWDIFLDLSRRLTRDLTNDGVIDVYAIAYENDSNCGLIEGLVYGNGANFATIDANGNFQDATSSAAFLEALSMYQTMLTEGLIKVPDVVRATQNPGAAAWDWYMSEFVDGRVAMIVAPEWAKTMFGEMVDDYGMVFPPKGPRATGYRMGNSCMTVIVPSFFTKEEVDVILTAFIAWTWPDTGVPEDPEGWKNGHWWAHRDRRAVDETGEMQRDNANIAYKVWTMIPGFESIKSEMTSMMFNFNGTPAQWVEQFTPRIGAVLDDANR